MDTVFEDYLAYSAGVRHFSEKTIEAYRNDLKLFSDWLADNELAFTEVTRTQVRIFVADLGNRHFAPASINRTLSCVRGLYRYALQKGLCTTNPAAVVRNLKQPDKLPRFLFPDEAERFCEFPKEAGILWYARDAAIFSSLYSTGCRAAELQGLKITDLKGDCSWAIVQGKGSKERKVFFADFAREAVFDGTGGTDCLPKRTGRLKNYGCGRRAFFKLPRRRAYNAGHPVHHQPVHRPSPEL